MICDDPVDPDVDGDVDLGADCLAWTIRAAITFRNACGCFGSPSFAAVAEYRRGLGAGRRSSSGPRGQVGLDVAADHATSGTGRRDIAQSTWREAAISGQGARPSIRPPGGPRWPSRCSWPLETSGRVGLLVSIPADSARPASWLTLGLGFDLRLAAAGWRPGRSERPRSPWGLPLAARISTGLPTAMSCPTSGAAEDGDDPLVERLERITALSVWTSASVSPFLDLVADLDPPLDNLAAFHRGADRAMGIS